MATMRKGVLVYISGAMSANTRLGTTIEGNVARGVEVYLDLLKRGIPAFCPHLSGAFPSAWTELTHAQWIEYDLAILDRCTHVLMLPGWPQSKGAVMEHDYANASRLPIFYSVEALCAALGICPEVAHG